MKLSITEGRREGKSKVIASCSFLGEMFLECTIREKRKPCRQRGNIRSGSEDKNGAVGNQRKGEETDV